MKPKVVVLVSGGLDSVTTLYHCRKQYQIVSGLSFDYGAKHNRKELPFASFHCRLLKIPHHTINLGFIGTLFESALLKGGKQIPDGHYESRSMKQTVVPFRNGIFIAVAGGFAESLKADGVVLAAHAGDHAIYPDCRVDFLKAMSSALRLGTYKRIQIFAPFAKHRKKEIVLRGHALGVDFSKTWSCYKGKSQHCGTCGTCTERREAFLLAGVPDPTSYLSQ